MTCKRSEVLCESGYADPKEGTQNVEACELELLCEVPLNRKNEFLQGEN